MNKFFAQNNLLVATIGMLIILAACDTAPGAPIPTATIALSPTLPSLTSSIPPPTLIPTATPIPPTQTSSIQGSLRMAYIFEDNLYVQDGSNASLQLTQGDRDRLPTFSNDGEKVVFLRRFIPHDLYSINADGSQEQVLVSGTLLEARGLGYSKLSEIRSFAFIPGTHHVIFNTRELDELDVKMQDWNRTGSKNNDDLLTVDTDSGEIKSLFSPGKGGNFVISPDGNTIAVQSKGHIDVVGIDGHMIRRNLATYVPTTPYELTPQMFWSADGTELLVTLPVREIYDMSGPETLSVWRYAIDGGGSLRVALDPPLLDGDYSISPDGNWILYNYFYYPGKTEETITSGLYLGNLRKGGSQLYEPGTLLPTWGPDSTHFFYNGLFLGVVDGPPVYIGTGSFLGWADASHYLYFNETIVMAKVGGEIINIPTDIPTMSVQYGPELFSFILLGNSAANK